MLMLIVFASIEFVCDIWFLHRLQKVSEAKFNKLQCLHLTAEFG